jgi:hypothetical protein
LVAAGEFAEAVREQFLEERMEYFKEVQRLLYVEALNEDSASKVNLVHALCKSDPEMGEKQVGQHSFVAAVLNELWQVWDQKLTPWWGHSSKAAQRGFCPQGKERNPEFDTQQSGSHSLKMRESRWVGKCRGANRAASKSQSQRGIPGGGALIIRTDKDSAPGGQRQAF